ncbi:MAG: 50S ribosomal protein L19 [Planctomycetota bacterium]
MKPIVQKFEQDEIARLLAAKVVAAGDVAGVAEPAAAAAPAGAKGKKKKRKKADKPVDMQYYAIGDDVDVHYRIVEGDKERIQIFSGTVIRRKGSGLTSNFTVRRIVQGEGVERIFPTHSPKLMKVVVTRRGRVRRAKLYYLRTRVGKSTKIKERLGEPALRVKKRAEKADMAFDARLQTARDSAAAAGAGDGGGEGDGD